MSAIFVPSVPWDGLVHLQTIFEVLMAPGSRLQELTAKYMQNPRRYFVPLANEYRKSNDLDRAIALCREHLPSQPGHMSGHIVLGRAYFEKGDVDAAREVFLTSVELDDENVIALRHLGDIAKSHHQLIEARQWYARVLDADPQNEEIERLLHALGTTEAADPEAAAAGAAAVEPEHHEEAAAVSEAGGPPAAELGLALTEATPPGLRAITQAAAETAELAREIVPSDARGHDIAPDPRVPLDRFDLSTLAAEPTSDTEVADGIRVDDGVGFIFDDLDELVDPAAAAATGSLPPIDEADFSAGIATPTTPRSALSEPVADEVLSRPAFGALASFASWRTAQGRETPTNPTAQPTPSARVPSQPVEAPHSDEGLFWQSATADTTTTAPEFITETMAALYERQGFTQQALEVYSALLVRAPSDAALRAKVGELRSVLASAPGIASPRADAESALDFADAELGTAAAAPMPPRERTPEGSPDDQELSSAFASAWDGPEAIDGDWFADVNEPAVAPDAVDAAGEIYGVSGDVFGIPARAGDGALRAGTGVVTSLASVFGLPAVLAADEAASELLLALASEMVGRLPKEAPTLPVPDVLDLPSPVAGDEVAGTSPAPLLSFDRFFSGSGAPPRSRPDTPVASSGVTDPWQVPVPLPPPSLSPTFGGVPVIPPASVTPATWAAFDQFLPSPARTPSLEPARPVASGAADPLPMVPAPPLPTPAAPPAVTPTPVTPNPVQVRAAEPPPAPSNPQAVAGEPLPFSAETPPAVPSGADPEKNAPAVAEPTRAAPSDFHRWLEGLS
jgi:tetratricopeptide (TPR) repeat protein